MDKLYYPPSAASNLLADIFTEQLNKTSSAPVIQNFTAVTPVTLLRRSKCSYDEVMFQCTTSIESGKYHTDYEYI